MNTGTLYEVKWLAICAPPITREMEDFLEDFGTDSGTFTLSLDMLNEALLDVELVPEVRSFTIWLRSFLADGDLHDFAIGKY